MGVRRGGAFWMLVIALLVGCDEPEPTPAVDGGTDRPRDSALDRPPDTKFDTIAADTPPGAPDLAPDSAADARPDQAPDIGSDAALDLPADQPAEPPVDAPPDLPPDLPADLPIDQPVEATSDSGNDTADAAMCVTTPIVMPAGQINKSLFVPISDEDAILSGCAAVDPERNPFMLPFTLTEPRRLVMYQAHSLQPPRSGFALTDGCTAGRPALAYGDRRCVPLVADLGPGTYSIVDCSKFFYFRFSIEQAEAPATNIDCAGAIDLTAKAHDEPRIVDGNARYYTVPVANAFTRLSFSNMEGVQLRIATRRDCNDPGTEEEAGFAELCLPSSSTSLQLNRTQGTYTVIVRGPTGPIPAGTKYTIGWF